VKSMTDHYSALQLRADEWSALLSSVSASVVGHVDLLQTREGRCF
jgi:hypothetical protein